MFIHECTTFRRRTYRLVGAGFGLIVHFRAYFDRHVSAKPADHRARVSRVSWRRPTDSQRFFVGFALGQLFWGPLSDKYGRRPMLIAGVILYIVTSALCASSTSIEALIGFRALQALGGGAGTVITRAIVRDRFNTDHSARVMSYMMLVTALAPLCAPLIGGYILKWFGWSAIFLDSVWFWLCLPRNSVIRTL